VDEARVEGVRPPHPWRAHAASGGREQRNVTRRRQTAAEVMLAAPGAAVSAERVGKRPVQVEPAGSGHHPVVRGRREVGGVNRRQRRRGAQRRRGPRRGGVGAVEPDLGMALPVVAGVAQEGGVSSVDGHPVDWPRPRRRSLRRRGEGHARHGHRQERRRICRRGGRGIRRRRWPQLPRRQGARRPFLAGRRWREQQIRRRRGSVQPPPRVSPRRRAAPPHSSSQPRSGRRRRVVAARQTDV
jgi:hypothetical protein